MQEEIINKTSQKKFASGIQGGLIFEKIIILL